MRDSTTNGQAHRTPRGRRVMILAALAGLAAAPTLLAADPLSAVVFGRDQRFQLANGKGNAGFSQPAAAERPAGVRAA